MRAAAVLLLAINLIGSLPAQSNPATPKIVRKDGRYALMVDGAPYLILGAQVNNSSAWPGMLPKVWPAMADIHANTVEIPVYWEQLEREAGRFDFSILDALLRQSREHNVRLILLWFGTWKNGSQHYMPGWMKDDMQRYFRVRNQRGETVDSPSPFAAASLEADKRAFVALMEHLRAKDLLHTVLMVQVENEPGTWDSIRDYSPPAQKAFESPVPQALLTALRKDTRGTWKDVFGEDADEFFHAWAVASYINQVAAAGKAVYPLPLYVNVALRDPFGAKRGSYESGGATDNVLDLWKAAAPAIDFIGPDIYLPKAEQYLKVLDLYARPDNALFIPETANRPDYARYLFAALGHGAVGWSPFGIDYTGYSNAPLGAARLDAEKLAPFAINYELLRMADREIARLNFEGKVQAVVEETGRPSQDLTFGGWNVGVSYGLPAFGPGDHPLGNEEPTGRALVAQLGPNEFLVGGFFCRVDFRVGSEFAGKHKQFIRVEEGKEVGGKFLPIRIWNGDQTDWGLNFSSAPQLLHVVLSRY